MSSPSRGVASHNLGLRLPCPSGAKYSLPRPELCSQTTPEESRPSQKFDKVEAVQTGSQSRQGNERKVDPGGKGPVAISPGASAEVDE